MPIELNDTNKEVIQDAVKEATKQAIIELDQFEEEKDNTVIKIVRGVLNILVALLSAGVFTRVKKK